MKKCLSTAAPRLVQRENGQWLAVSHRFDSLRIGVTGLSVDDATARFEAARSSWLAMLEDATADRSGIATP